MKIKNIDEFLENSFIPRHVIYTKNKDNDFNGESSYEKHIPLYRILYLKLTDEEKNIF